MPAHNKAPRQCKKAKTRVKTKKIKHLSMIKNQSELNNIVDRDIDRYSSIDVMEEDDPRHTKVYVKFSSLNPRTCTIPLIFNNGTSLSCLIDSGALAKEKQIRLW